MNRLQITIELLTERQLPELMALQEKVITFLERPEFLQPLTKEEFLNILNGNGMLAGAFKEGRLIAFRAMLNPGDDDEHLGTDIGIPQQELSSVLYSEVSCVDPEFRGNGLQTILGRWLLEKVQDYRYVCTTVAPFNIPSLKDKFALGMAIGALKMKYGQKLRYVLWKDLQQETSVVIQEEQAVPMEETRCQQTLIREGWTGVRLEQRADAWYTVYVR